MPQAADPPQEPQCFGVTASEQVLTVIDALVRMRIAKGVGAAAERWARFEDGDVDAVGGERGGGGQARPSSTDDGDSSGARPGARDGSGDSQTVGALDSTSQAGNRQPINVRAKVVAAMSMRAGRGTRITRVNTS